MLAASVRGASHERTRQPCQDALVWRVCKPGCLCAAVADGAGSAPLAEVGSSIAARAACDSLETFLAHAPAPPDEPALRKALEGAMAAARKALEDEAKKRECPLRDLATTLCLLVAGPRLAGAAQIGDGAVLAGERTPDLATLTRPASGEYLNETVFLTADDALAQVQYTVRPGAFRQAALFSDGLQMLALKLPDGAPHAPFFTPLFQYLAAAEDLAHAGGQLQAFLQSPRITQRTDDDLTLLLAEFKPAGKPA